jgi:hypothetical protein
MFRPVFKGIYISKVCVLQFFLIAVTFSLVSIQLISTRPMQDDYFLLGALADSSWLDFMKNIWEWQGGNLWPYGANAMLVQNSIYSNNFTVIALWTLITLSITTCANYVILKWALGENFISLGRFKILTIASLSYLAFEGLFSPGLIAAYSFHQTSFSHLYPISLLFISLYLIEKEFNKLSVGILLGILIGNSNASESLAAISILLLLYLLSGTELLRSIYVFPKKNRFFYGLIFGGITGILLIFLAPGFWNRAHNSVGLPSSPFELFNRFFRAISSFGADVLTHPMIWLSLLIGIVFSSLIKDKVEDKFLIAKIKGLSLIAMVIFLANTFGSTFGYVAWWQSVGFYQILIPISFLMGMNHKSIVKINFSQKFHSFVLIIIITSITMLSIRFGMAISTRSSEWDMAFSKNYCVIKNDTNTELIGADMLYTGFDLGIEDIAKWQWMRESYINWVSNSKFKVDINC